MRNRLFILYLGFILSNWTYCQGDKSLLNTKVYLDHSEWVLSELLNEIYEKYEIVFSFGDIDEHQKVNSPQGEVTLERILNEIFKDTSLSYTVKGKKVLIFEIKRGNRPFFDQTIQGKVMSNDIYDTPLFGANIVFPKINGGTTSGVNGTFSVPNLPRGTYSVRVSFVGYKSAFFEINVPSDTLLIFRLEEDLSQLNSVEIRAQKVKPVLSEQTPISTINISEMPTESTPRLLGEQDLIRIIQNLPGVKNESDFTGGFSVRGGRNDQNLILLDGVPVYNPWHLFGVYSAFNTEALERVDFTKGVFPAQYGSRVSSVLDIELQKGEERLGAGYLNLSPISATFSYGRPLNQKTSYLFAVRRTYLDPLFWAVNIAASSQNARSKTKWRSGYNFMDLNAKVVHTFKPGLSLETGFFVGNDVLTLSEKNIRKDSPERTENKLRYGWTNLTGSVKLIRKEEHYKATSHLFVSKYFADNIFKDYYAGMSQDGHSWLEGFVEGYALTDDKWKQRFRQQFTDFGAQQDFSHYLSENTTISTGAQLLIHNFREVSKDRIAQYGFPFGEKDSPITTEDLPPIELVYNYSEGDTTSLVALESSAYLNGSFNMGKVSFYPGVRLQHYSKGNYLHVLPRLNTTYRINESWYVSGGYGHFTQYLQTVGLEVFRIPAERWFWANGKDRKPVFTRTVTAGVGYDHSQIGSFKLEGYHKTFDNLLNFSTEQQADALESEFVPLFGTETISGMGEAYGVEFLWQKNQGKVRGWFGYTLSWVWNQFDELNNGDRFPSRTDKRHDIQTFWTYDFSPNWSVGALFNYKTGQPFTLSTGNYLFDRDPLDIGGYGGDSKVIGKMNNYRLPAYHRLDLSITWKNRQTFKRRSELSLNVINVYNRLNVLTATNSTSLQELPNGKIRVNPGNKYTSQMPIIPMLSLRIALGGDAK